MALVVMVAVSCPVLAQDEDDEDETGGPGGGQFAGHGAGAAAVEWAPEFHPVYKIGHTRDQDISSWKHDFNLSYPFSRKVSFNATSSITIRENAVLNRENRNETWRAALNVGLSSALTTGLRFTRSNQVDVRNEGAADEVKSFREKESVNLTTSYKKDFLDDLNLSLGASGGLEKNRYSDVKSTGTTQKIDAGIEYASPIGLKTNFNYVGTHSLLDSEQGEVESQDESFDHSLSGRVEYEWEANRFNIDLRQSTGRKEYPKEQQTERRKNDTEGLSATAELDLLPGLSTRIGFDYSKTSTFYRLEPSKDSDIATRGVESSLGYTVGSTKFTAELRSERKRNEYFDVQTGNTYSNSIGGSIAHDFNERVKAALRGRMSLLSHQYDDTDKNDQDRDLFDREATLTLDYTPRAGIRTSLLLKVREDNLIYIRTTRTADNKTTQTYSIKPSISKNFGPRVSVSQAYDLSADYTFYTYDPDSNFLIRNFVLTTGLNWKPLEALTLVLSHKYRAQDEGTYIEDEYGVERYGRNSQREDNSLGLSVKYLLFGVISIEAGQELSVQRKWTYEDEVKEFSWEKFDTRLTGKASADYTLEDGTALKLSVGRTHRDATNILDRQREVWDVSLNIDKTF